PGASRALAEADPGGDPLLADAALSVGTGGGGQGGRPRAGSRVLRRAAAARVRPRARDRVPRDGRLRGAATGRPDARDDARALGALSGLPPYGRPGFEPVPHATLTRYANPINATFEQAKARVEPLLPVHCIVTEAILQEEYELDRMRVRETFHFAG